MQTEFILLGSDRTRGFPQSSLGEERGANSKETMIKETIIEKDHGFINPGMYIPTADKPWSVQNSNSPGGSSC